ncbi:MAG: cbb3-type cytochrome oxidase assembly protein CcoS [Lewinellaceae bacterium]|nr:cbb3-type cytochrome oxidase assembly protein CcoS [Saprospiraceae bacterium]MCB9339971.1 cbb3-type cytochrome oxidase assembly protein CcoS [Lewinellaceae bacterium]
MKIIFVLIAVSLLVALGFLAAFIWAVKSGQYEDDYTPSIRMLFDDKPAPSSRSANPKIHSTDK